MDHLARNADGDELLFVHEGTGDLFCDYGHLAFEAGDYIVLPRGTMWRLECDGARPILLIEATNGRYMLPDKGLVGDHAIFDPAMLDVPRVDEAFKAQTASARPWRVVIKRRDTPSRPSPIPYNPLDAIGWHGDLAPVPHQRARYPSADVAIAITCRRRAHTTFVATFRGLHLRAPPVRDRPGRDQGPVLP